MSHVQLLIVFDKPAEESAVAAAALLSFSIAASTASSSSSAYFTIDQFDLFFFPSNCIAAIENYPRNELVEELSAMKSR